MKRTLFIDKLEKCDIGGATRDKRKIEYILAVYGFTSEKILRQVPKNTKIPAGAFHSGKYAVFYSMDRDLKDMYLGFINYNIDLDENFNLFADNLSPKSVQGFHNLKEIIKQKNEEELNSVELSDNNSDFEIAYKNYIEYLNKK